MKKIINDSAQFVDESVDGILLAHGGDLRTASGNRRALVRIDAPRDGKVGIVTGGGSGHLPAFLGYVGFGLCDGVAVGNVFSSPSAEVIHAATREVSGGAGVLYLYGNYGGDIYNFDLAADLAAIDGIPTRTVLAADDVASAPPERAHSRRGVAGMFYAFKIAGAAAERGDNLDQVSELAQRASDSVRTMGVGLSPTILPAAGEPTFILADGEMEVGIGIHGEPGIHRGKLETADAIADRLLTAVIDDLSLVDGSAVSLLVNGMGATPLEELYVLYRRAHHILSARGVSIRLPFVGNFVTSLEMAGASISVIALDDELEILLDAQAYSPFFAHEPVRGGSRPMGSPQTRSGARVAASRDEALADAQTEFRSAADNVDDHSDSGGEVVPTALARLLSEVFRRLPEHADELRDLDAALGDGDLGITISLGSVAALDAIDRNARESDSVLLQRVGTAFAGANPSTFAALVGGGILFAASRLGADIVSDRVALERFGRDVALRIFERGGASLGDKTVLDAIVPSLDVLSADQSAAPGVVLDRMIEAVRAAISATTPQRSARGRAAWLQDRSMGAADPGMAAYLAFLVELKGAFAE